MIPIPFNQLQSQQGKIVIVDGWSYDHPFRLIAFNSNTASLSQDKTGRVMECDVTRLCYDKRNLPRGLS